MKIYMIGICGSAMANLASLLQEQGHQVSGSDQNIYPPMSDFLKEKNISIDQGYAKPISADVDLVVVGNAISRGNSQAEQMLREKRSFMSMPEAIGKFLMQDTKNVVVSGTHGKTTTTAMIVHMLRQAGLNPGFLIGGIALDIGPGIGSGGQLPKDPIFVIEGDEYDSAFFDKRSKFVHYAPDILIINNMEFDHADIFDDIKAIERSFRQVINLVPDNGLIIANGDDGRMRRVLKKPPAPVLYFGEAHNSDRALRIQNEDPPMKFELDGASYQTDHIWGGYNALNASAAILACEALEVKRADLAKGIKSFKGVKRRQEKICEWANGALFYQDFAHHPTSIGQTLKLFRAAFPKRRLIAVLEPRSNTMVRNFHQETLLEALVNADMVYMAGLHRRDQIPQNERLDREKILRSLKESGKETDMSESSQDIFTGLHLNTRPNDLVIVLSNGSFDGLIEEIRREEK